MMKPNLIFTSIIKAAIIAIFTFSANISSSHAGTQCKNPVKERGMKYKKRSKAKTSAISRWEKRVSMKYGVNYSKWKNAKRKHITCIPNTHNIWSCVAVGKPCKNTSNYGASTELAPSSTRP